VLQFLHLDMALTALSPQLTYLYVRAGRPSIASEKILRALLLQMLYSLGSERLHILPDGPQWVRRRNSLLGREVTEESSEVSKKKPVMIKCYFACNNEFRKGQRYEADTKKVDQKDHVENTAGFKLVEIHGL